jgi:hypothetical protein
MTVLGRAWRFTARAKRRLRPPGGLDYEAVIRKYAPGRAFADIGCMWKVHGELSFVAEEAGATAVTAVDMMPRTEEFDRKHRDRNSRVRYVKGDVHKPETVDEVGVHDVVWCTGVLYHTPNPMLLISRLRALTGEYLILGSAVMPEVPGLAQACVFYPGLGDSDRELHEFHVAGRALGITEPFDMQRGYDSWWFGISPSALTAMVEVVGFDVVEMFSDPFLALMVARRRQDPPAAG